MKTLIAFAGGLIVGAATGTTVALLNAPQSGKKTRKKLQSGIEEARTRTEEAIADARAATLEKLDEAKNLVREFGNEARQSLRASN